MRHEACISDERLAALAAGSVDDSNTERIAAHIERCERCRDRLTAFKTDATFTAKLPAAAREPTSALDDADATIPTTREDARRSSTFPEIPGFEILKEIGRGGMGVVYKALQTPLGREVALKILPSNLATLRPDAVDRFRREAAAASKLHHHNIIPIYDFGTAHGAYYYAMELIEGQSLNVLVRRLSDQNAAALSAARLADVLSTGMTGTGDLPSTGAREDATGDDSASVAGSSTAARGRVYYQQVARWMAEAADALHYAHGHGVVHRDIKPANLMLAADGRIMLADFGLAKVAGGESITVTGSLIGTWRYMSPEQALARRMPVDHRTDIYSLGATMYELLVFQPAVKGRDEKEIITQIITREPTPPRRIIRTVPRDLETICLKTLEKDPDHRFATARALAADLQRYIADLPIVIKRPGPIKRIIKFVKRHKASTIAACVAFLLVVTSAMLVRSTANARAARIRELENAATLYAKDGNYSAAERTWRDAVEMDPDDVRLLVFLAIAKKDLANTRVDTERTEILENAEELCQDITRRYPRYAWGHNTHGVILKMLGRFDEAIAAYGEVTTLKPEWYAGWVNLGTMCALNKDFPTAEQHLQKSVNLAREHLDDPNAVDAWRNLASLQLHLGERDAAEASIKQATECNPKDVGSWLIKARLLLAGDPVAAAESARIAESHQGTERESKIQRILALAYLRTGGFKKAIANALEAIDGDDLPTLNHFIIAIAHAGLGDTAAAREHLDQAPDPWPDDLADEGAYRATADKGVLWFETHAELQGLRDEAESAIAHTP